jgi:hypothetical protein
MFLSKWSRGVLAVTAVKNNGGRMGSSFEIVGRDLTRKVYWSYEVTASEPNKIFAGRARGGAVPFSESFSLEAVGQSATEIIHTHEIQPSGLLRLAGPIFRLVWPRLMRDNLKSLKLLVEGNTSGRPQVAPSLSQ